jgi:hypothetical protein
MPNYPDREIIIEPSGKLIDVDGTRVMVFRGITAAGLPCVALVQDIRAAHPDEADQLVSELEPAWWLAEPVEPEAVGVRLDRDEETLARWLESRL